jgi:ketosteroid isomerase-like protein
MKCFAVALVLVFASPLSVVSQQTPPPQETIRQEIERLNRSMMEAWQRNDALAIAAHYSDDARIIGPSGNAVEGRANVNRYWTGFPTQGRTWTLTVIEAGGTRDLAYQYGRSSISGGARSQVVDFIGVWKRQPNGELKLAIDYWVPSR